MTLKLFRSPLPTVSAILALSTIGVLWFIGYPEAQAAPSGREAREVAFKQSIKPFLTKNCVSCHNADAPTAGIKLDVLDASFDDRQIAVWEAVQKRLAEGTMPPKGMPQPDSAERTHMGDWIAGGLLEARVRQGPKNGLVRRLTVAQYRNTLRELTRLDDDLTSGIPPDAVSKDGFVNNQETLQLSALLLESYFEIADEALRRAIVDPKSKPSIQDFKVELGTSINAKPFPEQLILGAGSQLLNNKDFVVTQPVPVKPFAFDQHAMRTKYRYIEGYQGNDTVRGWREYDSIYHAVFADMRGSAGYPKGTAYGTVPGGLLLRPAIPNDEQFGTDGTYGPKANFKLSVRELPDEGRFRVTVTAAKYNDGLILDPGTPPQPEAGAGAIVSRDAGTQKTVTIPAAGVYQVDLYSVTAKPKPEAPDASHLTEGLTAEWKFDDAGAVAAAGVKLQGKATFVDSPFGKAASFSGDESGVAVPRSQAVNVGTGDFSAAFWIQPKQAGEASILAAGASAASQGWFIDLDPRGAVRLQATGADSRPAGSVSSPRGSIRPNTWQHVAISVQRGKKNGTRIYVNGFAVAKGDIAAVNLDNEKVGVLLGRLSTGLPFRGELDEVRIYRRALREGEVLAMIQPGQQFVKAPQAGPGRRPQQVEATLTLGDREFSSGLAQPSFVAVRLPAGPLKVDAQMTGMSDIDRVVLTPLPATHTLTKRFVAFEKRSPHVGVHLGFRRDCGSTFTPVGPPQTVASEKLTRYVFEGAMRNFPNTEVEKDNVNYLAGVREIGVRSEYTDGRDMPRLLIKSVEFEGPFYDQWPPASHKNIFVDSANKQQGGAAYAQDILRSFATKAYRRPATAEEVGSLMAVYRKSAEGGRPFQDSVKDALQVVLTSPQFLFLIENSRTPGPEPLDGYELASKLSYFLWNGPPDATTLRLASAGTLQKGLDAETTRMMGSPKFSRFTREFTSQWLNLDKFTVLEPDRKLFPQLTGFTRTQLREEPIHFVDYLIRKNLPVKNLVASDFVMANETVAGYYGLSEKTESGFEFTAIPHGRRELGGVLTEAAIMAGLSDGRESNPVKRGAWLARKIIAEPPADPPPNVPVLKEDKAHTLRERIEQHRNQPACQQCHSKIDPWGVALEEFDAGGRLKEKAADAHSTLPDKTEVAGITDLKRYLTQDRVDQVAYSVLKHMATYGAGRTLTYSELNSLKLDLQKQDGLKKDGYRMQDMVRYVVNSKVFLEK